MKLGPAIFLVLILQCMMGGRAAAQLVDNFFDVPNNLWAPDRLSLEGTWRMPAREHPLVSVFPKIYSGPGEYPSDALKNTGMDGFDTLQLVETGSRIWRETNGFGNFFAEHHVREYEGAYVHRHTHYGITSAPKGISFGPLTHTLNYDCISEEFEYAVKATLTLNFNADGEFITYDAAINGKTDQIPEVYVHGTEMYAFGGGTDFFKDSSGDVMGFSSFRFDSLPKGPNIYREPCNLKTVDFPYPVYADHHIGLSTLGEYFWRVGAPRTLVRDAARSPSDRTGTISGILRARASTLEIKRGRVRLYQQTLPVRPPLEGESESDYLKYILPRLEFQEERRVEADGRFKFSQVPIMRSSRNDPSIFMAARYTIIAAGAEADNTFLPDSPVIYFREHAERGFTPDLSYSGSERVIPLDPIEATAEKRTVALALQRLSPGNYKAVEDPVLQHLTRLESGELSLTPAAEECVKRAIWAERAVREGGNQANELIKVMLEGVAGLVSQAISEFVVDRNSRAARGKAFVDRVNKAEPGQNVFIGFGLAQGPTREASIQMLIKDAETSSLLSNAERGIGSATTSLETALLAAGMTKSKAASINKMLKLVVKGVFAAAKFGTGLDRSVKKPVADLLATEAVRQTAPLLFDNSLELNFHPPWKDAWVKDSDVKLVLARLDSFPSYCSITKPSLAFAANRLIGCDLQENPRKYQSDSTQCADMITDLIQDGVGVRRETLLAQAISKSAVDSIKIIGPAGVLIPQAKSAEKLLKLAALGGNAWTFVRPAYHVFAKLPPKVDAITRRAYGLAPAPPLPPPPGPTLADVTSGLPSFLATDIVQRNLQSSNVLVSLRQALLQNQLGTALSLCTNPVTGVSRTLQNLSDSATRVTTLAGTITRYNYAEGMSADQLAGMGLRFQMAIEDLRQELLELFGSVYSGDYPGPGDSRYLDRRNSVLAAVALAETTARELVPGLNGWLRRNQFSQFKPALDVRLDSIRSAVTGRSTILRSNELFVVRAHVANLSTVALSNLQARLTLSGPEQAVIPPASSLVSVGTGRLASMDSKSGSGPDEADVEWSFQWTGGSVQTTVFVSVDVLEGEEEPDTFVAHRATQVLSVDPALGDLDGDGLPDSWERAHGLDPLRDDSASDPDHDGLSNRDEYDLGLDPMVADSDGDGLYDGDEIAARGSGFATDPDNPDTDGDGVPDGVDGAPLDSGVSDAVAAPLEPRVGLSLHSVRLHAGRRSVVVTVTNAGAGELLWSARRPDNSRLQIAFGSSAGGESGGSFRISVPDSYDFAQAGPVQTRVRVVDVGGNVHDVQEVLVTIDGALPGSVLLPRVAYAGRGAGGRPNLEVLADLGDQVAIEYSDDMKTWLKLPAVTAATGRVVIPDTGPVPVLPRRFYRASLQR